MPRQEVESVARATVEFHTDERIEAPTMQGGFDFHYLPHALGLASRGLLLRTRVWWTHTSLHHALNRKQSRV